MEILSGISYVKINLIIITKMKIHDPLILPCDETEGSFAL